MMDSLEPFLSPKLKTLTNRPTDRFLLELSKSDPENADYWKKYSSRRHVLWQHYVKSESAFWRANEINWMKDIIDFRTRLSDAERHIVRMILAFFATGDGVVGDNLKDRFAKCITSSEANHFYVMQTHMELIHGQVYLDALKAFVPEEDDQMRLINAFHELPVIRAKTEFAQKYTADLSIPFNQLNFVYAIFEGLFFSSSFLFIAWFKRDARLPMFGTANEMIQRDEGLHRDFAVAIQHTLKYPLTEDIATPIMREAVKLAVDFAHECLPNAIGEMSAELMTRHIHAVADKLMYDFGFKPIYGQKNTPYTWFIEQRLSSSTNFFELEATEYTKEAEFCDTDAYKCQTDDF